MPDFSGITALDVAIGLAFLFFLLSTIVAGIQEMVAGWLGWRAQELEKALRSYFAVPKEGADPLGEPEVIEKVQNLFGSPRIASLVDDARNAPARLTKWLNRGETRRSPSYIPARAFALTVLDTFNPPLPGQAGEVASRNAIAEAKSLAEQIEVESVRRAVVDALDQGRSSLEDIRKEVERSFDQLMDRCSGWYKRRAQKFLLLFAVLVAIGVNVDAFHVADRLSKDDALRAAVVQRASTDAEGDQQSTTTTDGRSPEERLADRLDDVQQLGVPIGWESANVPNDFWSWLGRLAGWSATVLALSLGAPFWFDVLGKFARLRNTGNREGTLKDDDRAAEDRDDPSRRRPALG
jgi:hypothetical protein